LALARRAASVKLDPESKRLLLETGRRHRLQDILAAALRPATGSP